MIVLRVVIIDNFDSFTFNLYHIINKYIHCCDVFRSDDNSLNINNYDKIIISPGPSLPSDHPLIFEILREYFDKKSILGICLGHQAILEYFGSRLINMDKVLHGLSSKNNILYRDSLFKNIPEFFDVAHYHSWVVDKSSLPNFIIPTSQNIDGLLMSFRHQNYDIAGLQFHPESILTPYGDKILKNWIDS